jgi:hypothetical protein
VTVATDEIRAELERSCRAHLLRVQRAIEDLNEQVLDELDGLPPQLAQDFLAQVTAFRHALFSWDQLLRRAIKRGR